MITLSSCPPGKPLFQHPNFLHKRRLLAFHVSATATAAAQCKHSMAAMTLYEVLAVESTAGPDEIRTAYRRQARRWHPDACQSCSQEDKRLFAERFMAARRAYELLSDPTRRREYDLAHLNGYGRAATAFTGGEVAWWRSGFGDWEAQLEGLKRRAKSRKGDVSTWGSRARKGNHGVDRSNPRCTQMVDNFAARG